MKEVQSVSVRQWRDGKTEATRDLVVRESSLRIILADSKAEQGLAFIRTVMTDPVPLITGLLFTTRLIDGVEDILQLSVQNQVARVRLKDACQFSKKLISFHAPTRIVTGACGPDEGALNAWRACDLPPIETSLRVPPSVVTRAIQQLNQRMPVFKQTGGTHGAALADSKGGLLVVAEDVGRHNAVDRAIGVALQKAIDCSTSLLACTGRLTADLVLKAAVARIPIVSSMGATVDSGIELANASGITLIGFVRGARMNIYTHPNRVQAASQ
jgi:FdhD protein